MPPGSMDIKLIYDQGVAEREKYLDAANDIAKLSLTTMEPKGEAIAERERPFTHQGALAVRSLASAMFKTMLPPGIKWARLAFTPEITEIINRAAGPGVGEALFARMAQRSGDVIESLEQKLSRSRGAKAIRRNIVEGNTLVINEDKGLTVFPLRSVVVDRQMGHIRQIVFKEEVEPTLEQKAREGTETAEKTNNYTLVKYPMLDEEPDEAKHGVWRQEGDDGTPKRLEDSVRQYFVFVSEVPEHENYSYGYAFDFLRLFAQINHGERSLGEAMAAAAYNRPIIKEGSTTAARWGQFIAGASGTPWIGNVEDFGWFISGLKIGDWSFVAQLMDRWAGQLSQTFAMGIKDRAMSADTSATAVLQIVDELDSQVQDLHTAYEETFQRALFMSELAIFERKDPLINEALAQEVPPELIAKIKIEVTTGVNVLARQQQLLKFGVQFLPAIVALDPRVQVEGGKLIETYADGLPFPTDGLWSVREMQPQGQPGAEGPAGPQGLPRTDTIMTAGGPQPPQPPQGAPPPGA